jgi:hypothetical protein
MEVFLGLLAGNVHFFLLAACPAVPTQPAWRGFFVQERDELAALCMTRKKHSER